MGNLGLLSELEELVLLSIAVLYDDGAYGLSISNEIEDKTGKKISLSAIHTVLYRLQDRGLVKSEMGGASNSRGGRRKRLFFISQVGKEMINNIRAHREQYWNELGDLSLGLKLVGV
jgi:DNA-binding PadR family transcriptional regulator